MSEGKTSHPWMPAIIAGIIGLAFVGWQQTAKDQSTNVGNLPATNANVETNATAISDLRDQLTKAIGDSRTASANALDAAIKLVREEINRREPEVLKYVDTLDAKKRQRVDGIERRMERLEKMFIDHISSPPPKHSH